MPRKFIKMVSSSEFDSGSESASDRDRKKRRNKRKRKMQFEELRKKIARLERQFNISESSDQDQGSSEIESRPILEDTQVPAQVHENTPVTAVTAILGADPTRLKTNSIILHEELVVRWAVYLEKGIDKDVKKELLGKYPVVENCPGLTPPKLNLELQSCLSEPVLRQDKFFARCQEELASSLTAVGSLMNQFLQDPEVNKEPLGVMADTAQILTNLHNTLSAHRRYVIMPHVKPDIKKVFEEAGIGEFLFGPDLHEKVKTNIAVRKAGSEMKTPTKTWQPRLGPSNVPSKTTVQKLPVSLNYQRPKFRTKMKKGRGEVERSQRYSRYQKEPQTTRHPNRH